MCYRYAQNYNANGASIKMKVTIYGSGYVGLVTAACLADVGNHVVCIDIDQHTIEQLNLGNVPIYEPGLSDLISKNVAAKRIEFTTDAAYGVQHSDVQFIAVGTPQDEDGSADLQYVLAVAKTIASHMTKPLIIVNKSTVPIGTADKVTALVQSILDSSNKKISFDVASNPEFLKEGDAINDFSKPDRVVIGTENKNTISTLATLYAPFNRNHDRVIFMSVRSAELTKYAANSLLATKISYMNELANLAERLGADIEEVRNGIGSDPRIGYHFIYPGCGYGGSCFPKDLKALSAIARENDYETKLIDSVIDVNERQKQVLFNKIEQYYGGDLKNKKFAIWGLSFKPNTDDMREASSRVLIKSLIDAGAMVQAYDPVATEEAKHVFKDMANITFCSSAIEACENADALVVVTEWSEFRNPDFDVITKSLKESVIFDGRNIYSPDDLLQKGFRYFAIGRGESLFKNS